MNPAIIVPTVRYRHACSCGPAYRLDTCYPPALENRLSKLEYEEILNDFNELIKEKGPNPWSVLWFLTLIIIPVGVVLPITYFLPDAWEDNDVVISVCLIVGQIAVLSVLFFGFIFKWVKFANALRSKAKSYTESMSSRYVSFQIKFHHHGARSKSPTKMLRCMELLVFLEGGGLYQDKYTTPGYQQQQIQPPGTIQYQYAPHPTDHDFIK